MMNKKRKKRLIIVCIMVLLSVIMKIGGDSYSKFLQERRAEFERVREEEIERFNEYFKVYGYGIRRRPEGISIPPPEKGVVLPDPTIYYLVEESVVNVYGEIEGYACYFFRTEKEAQKTLRKVDSNYRIISRTIFHAPLENGKRDEMIEAALKYFEENK